jgi:hypothetical protein
MHHARIYFFFFFTHESSFQNRKSREMIMANTLCFNQPEDRIISMFRIMFKLDVYFHYKQQ